MKIDRSFSFYLIPLLISIGNVVLIWSFRFLPLYDYSVWLYEVKIMHLISEEPFHSAYQIATSPVPNLGLIVPVWLISFIVPIEAAGKIFLSVCVICLPWSFWYCVRSMSGNRSTPIAYAAFPFAFNMFFFGGQAFVVGMCLLFLGMGFVFRKSERLSMNDWIVLSFIVVSLYFAHALTYVIGVLVFAGILLGRNRKDVWRFGVVLVPSVICCAWYLASSPSDIRSVWEWSVWGLLLNVFKPLFLFSKSYSFPNLLPLTWLNVAWVGILASATLISVWQALRTKAFEKRLIVPIGLLTLLTLALPESAFGVFRPGSRFGFAVVFLIFLAIAHTKLPRWWSVVSLSVASLVLLYNVSHFQRVDNQMCSLYDDIDSTMPARGSFCVVRLDWPPERNLRDVAAASVDPLYGGVYYAALQRRCEGWIFGTSLLRLRPGRGSLKPVLEGDTPEAHALSFVASATGRVSFNYTVLVGRGRAVNMIADPLTQSGFRKVREGQNWTILTHDGQ